MKDGDIIYMALKKGKNDWNRVGIFVPGHPHIQINPYFLPFYGLPLAAPFNHCECDNDEAQNQPHLGMPLNFSKLPKALKHKEVVEKGTKNTIKVTQRPHTKFGSSTSKDKINLSTSKETSKKLGLTTSTEEFEDKTTKFLSSKKHPQVSSVWTSHITHSKKKVTETWSKISSKRIKKKKSKHTTKRLINRKGFKYTSTKGPKWRYEWQYYTV